MKKVKPIAWVIFWGELGELSKTPRKSLARVLRYAREKNYPIEINRSILDHKKPNYKTVVRSYFIPNISEDLFFEVNSFRTSEKRLEYYTNNPDWTWRKS